MNAGVVHADLVDEIRKILRKDALAHAESAQCRLALLQCDAVLDAMQEPREFPPRLGAKEQL